MSAHERSKLDRYPGYLFLNVYAVATGDQEADITLSEISAFATERALVTVRSADFDIDQLLERWNETADLAGNGVSWLLHGLLDLVVDQHFETIQVLNDETDQLADLLFEEASRYCRSSAAVSSCAATCSSSAGSSCRCGRS